MCLEPRAAPDAGQKGRSQPTCWSDNLQNPVQSVSQLQTGSESECVRGGLGTVPGASYGLSKFARPLVVRSPAQEGQWEEHEQRDCFISPKPPVWAASC